MSEPRDTENWAKPVEAFQVGEVAEGRRLGHGGRRRAHGAGRRSPLRGQLQAVHLENKIWVHTLTRLADSYSSSEPVSMTTTLIDKRRQWDKFSNIWKNSAVRTLLRQDRRVGVRDR